MIAYALLHYLGYERSEALRLLKEMREITYEQAGEERLKWAEQFYKKA